MNYTKTERDDFKMNTDLYLMIKADDFNQIFFFKYLSNCRK